jgi:hypothetical protein
MALIKRFERTTMLSNHVHGEAPCTYTVFQDDSGDRFLQIDTYGSATRKLRGKKSQSIQLDASSARALYALVADTFELGR